MLESCQRMCYTDKDLLDKIVFSNTFAISNTERFYFSMVGFGTILNTAAIVCGGILGIYSGKFMKERYQETMQRTCGVCVLFIGIAGAMEKMLTVKDGALTSGYSILITVCLLLGAIVGELCNIEGFFERFGEWLKRKTHSTKDHSFVNGFVTASLTVSIGAMAIVGAIEDGMTGNWSILAAKAVLDFIIVLVMTCSLGKGCIFSAIPVLVFEGLMTVFAAMIKSVITELALSYISLVGSVLIFCVGINLVWDKKIRVANLLPAILFAAGAAFLPIFK